MPVEPGGREQRSVGGGGRGDRVDDGLERGLAVAVLAVEEAQGLGLARRQGEGGAILGMTFSRG